MGRQEAAALFFISRLVGSSRPRRISLCLGSGDARLDLLTRLFARGIKRRLQLSDPSLQRIHLLRQCHGTLRIIDRSVGN